MNRLRDEYSSTSVMAIACALLLAAGAADADNLNIQNVTVAPRDETTATVRFDISWENSWRHGSFHDAAWVFFKVQADNKAPWQPVRLVADKVVSPTGYGQQKGGTPLEFVVPVGDDGFVGMFVRRAEDGKGALAARGVTAVWDFTANKGVPKDLKGACIRAFGIEMVYVAEGPFYLGSGGTELNRFHGYVDDTREIPQTPAYLVKDAGAIPTGRQQGKLWAVGIAPEDNGEIPASFPNGYAAFYCMKYCSITRGQYADFLNTLTPSEAKERYYADGHGWWIDHSGEPPNDSYAARPPDELARRVPWAVGGLSSLRCPWLSWEDCAAFAAWAGLRPMTELEYEKACRGPRTPVPNEQGPSYGGIPELNTGLMYERTVSAGTAAGREFAGTHGRGTAALPSDWPSAFEGVVYRGDYLHMRRYSNVGHLRFSGRSNANSVHSNRGLHPFPGWRGVRSAPAGDAAMVPVPGRLGSATVQTLERVGRAVRVDGVLDEWDEPLAILSGPTDLFPVYRRFAPFNYYGRFLEPWQGPGDLDAKVYLAWDGEAVCVAAEVTDDRHLNTKTSDSISGGDALQMGLVTADGVRWNVGSALTQTGIAFHQWEGEGETLLKTAECAVARDDKAKVTRYELRLPLAALGVQPGAEFGFNMVLFDDDEGNENLYWLQLAPGLAGLQDIKLYPWFVLR